MHLIRTKKLDWTAERYGNPYTAKVDRFCCDRMEEAWGEHNRVGFGAIDWTRLETHDGVYLYYFEHAYVDDVVLGSSPIDFCPFCGEAIEIGDEQRPS